MRTISDNSTLIGNRRDRIGSYRSIRKQQYSTLQKHLAIGLIVRNVAGTRFAMFLEDASHKGKYRYQTFDADGFSSHHTSNSLEEALKDAYESGYREIAEPSTLDKLSSTKQWSLGMQMQTLRDAYNYGDISWEEMIRSMKTIEQKE